MAWQDEYQQASFRGVEFFVARAEYGTGRRTQLHQFPQREVPYSEDLGRKARKYAIDGYILGDDFFTQKEDLIRAVEAPGPGKLVHPYYGELLVSCNSCRISDSNRELRMARFTMEFEESGEELEPKPETNTVATTDLAKKFSLGELNAKLVAALLKIVEVISKIEDFASQINDVFDAVNNARAIVSAVAAFQQKILDYKDKGLEFVNDVEALADAVIDVMTFGTFPFEGEVKADTTNSKGQADELVPFFNYGGDTPATGNGSEQTFRDFVSGVAAVTVAGFIPQIEFATLEDAEAYAQTILDEFDRILDSGVDDNGTVEAYRIMREAVLEDIQLRTDRLARVAEITLVDSVPAVVLSNSLYGDVDSEQELVDRNKVDHPGFMPAGREIQVLVNV